jgi:hypothetical protein
MVEILLSIVGGVLLIAVGLVVLGYVKVRSLRTRHRRSLAAIQPTHSEPASLVGLASEGKLQSRGVGTLAVGDSHLVFVQLVPEREILVPRDAITSSRATRHFLGKTTGTDLLVVTWDVSGLADAAAFAVPDVEEWRQRLE